MKHVDRCIYSVGTNNPSSGEWTSPGSQQRLVACSVNTLAFYYASPWACCSAYKLLYFYIWTNLLALPKSTTNYWFFYETPGRFKVINKSQKLFNLYLLFIEICTTKYIKKTEIFKSIRSKKKVYRFLYK